MWPRRKICLATHPKAPGMAGLEALLKQFELQVEVRNPESIKDYHNQVNIWGFEDTPPTDIIYGMEKPTDETSDRLLISLGINVQYAKNFLSELWRTERMISLSQDTPLNGDKPLLYAILTEAGFEPSLLWGDEDKGWICELGRGFPWIVPEVWLKSLGVEGSLGREPSRAREAHCEMREDAIDFYMGNNGIEYRGTIKRQEDRVDSAEENALCEVFLWALDLGIPWESIERTLADSQKVSNLRWNCKNDNGELAGKDGNEIPPAETEYLENRWAG